MLYEFTEHELLMPYLNDEQIVKLGGLLWMSVSNEKNKQKYYSD